MAQASSGRNRARRYGIELPAWQLLVAAIVGAAVVSCGVAALAMARDGVDRPLFLLGAIGCTAIVNGIYVVVVRKRDVFEAIDISEAPVVALALLLPPAEALCAIALGTLAGEVFRRRAAVKKAFNASIRVAAASLALMVTGAAGLPDRVAGGQVIGLLAGAVLYTAVTAAGVAAVLSLVEGRSVFRTLSAGLGMRAVVWCSAVLLGVTAANLAMWHAAGLLGLAGPLSIVWMTTHARGRAERNSERLQALVEATADIQTAPDETTQENALLVAARDLFPLRDVSVRDEPPAEQESGATLWLDGNQGRWLVLAPRPGCDPWRAEDGRMLTALTASVTTAVDRVRLQRELVRQANLDPLTGLANRRCFERELETALTTHPHGVAVLLLDLDGFKQVNDQYGHAIGDELLAIVAQRLNELVRSDDLVARLGGDEFVVLLPGVVTEPVAHRIVDAIHDSFSEPVEIGDLDLAITPSIGIAIAPRDGRSAGALMRRADQLMYLEKDARRAVRRVIELA